MVIETILSSDLVMQIILPFLLIFVLVFAILQKSSILGEGKNQIDALVALSVALIFVAFNWATQIVTEMMPYLAIALVAILVFVLIYGFVATDKENGLTFPNWVKIGVGVLAVVVVAVSLLVATGQWDKIIDGFEDGGVLSEFWVNLLVLVVVAAAVVAVVWGGKKKNNNSGGD